ncbi:MAG: ATPase domain-containing protein [Candidatus Heimdallarchaeaceae archaeon]
MFISLGALKKNIPVVYISTEVEPDKLIEYMDSFNVDLRGYLKDQLLILDKISLKPKGVNIVQTNLFDLSGVIERTKSK